MSGYFRRLAERAQGGGGLLAPRPASRFEGMPEGKDEIAAEESWSATRTVPGPGVPRAAAAPGGSTSLAFRFDDPIAAASPASVAAGLPAAVTPARTSRPAAAMAWRRVEAAASPGAHQEPPEVGERAAQPTIVPPAGTAPAARVALPASPQAREPARRLLPAIVTASSPSLAPLPPPVFDAPQRSARDASPSGAEVSPRAGPIAAVSVASTAAPSLATARETAPREARAEPAAETPRRADRRLAPAAAAPVPPAAEISIGRVEVRFTPPPAAPAPRAGGPPPLDALLARARR